MTQQPETYPCSQCGARMQTKDTRPAMYLGRPAVRRRRACKRCQFRETTYELAESVLARSDTRLQRTMPRLRQAQAAIEELIAEYDGVSHAGEDRKSVV